MNTLARWGRFNLVGLVGVGVQLAALALLNRWLHGRYLLASSFAIELTLLHNFLWHRCYTWRDRHGEDLWKQQLLRFHLTSGVVSLAGNGVIMRALVHGLRMPVLVANLIAIASTGLVNFWLSDAWTFFNLREPVGAAPSAPGTQSLAVDRVEC